MNLMLYYLKINYPTAHRHPHTPQPARAKDVISDLVLGAIGAGDGSLVRLTIPEPPLENNVGFKPLETHHFVFVQFVLLEYPGQLVSILVYEGT
jgi:hypothetical protein